jgi:hypothetical protein
MSAYLTIPIIPDPRYIVKHGRHLPNVQRKRRKKPLGWEEQLGPNTASGLEDSESGGLGGVPGEKS